MKYMVGQGYDSYANTVAKWEGSTLDISKATYDTLFYYVTKRMPVFTMVDGHGLVCIDGYNGYSGSVHTVYMTDLATGEEFDMGYYATNEGIISTGSEVFRDSVEDYMGDVDLFKIVSLKTKKGTTYKVSPILTDNEDMLD